MTATAVLLVGHGSRDARSAATMGQLAAVLARRTGGRVAVSHLELTPPSPTDALVALADGGHWRVDVRPLLFTPGYHISVDLPAHLAAARARRPDLELSCAGPLLGLAGAPQLLLQAMEERLAEAGAGPADALVLAASGSSRPEALGAVEALAGTWSERRRVPVRTGYAAGAGPRVGDVVRSLAREGHRVAVGSLFAAPGRLPDLAREAARAAGAQVGAPLGVHRCLLDLLHSC